MSGRSLDHCTGYGDVDHLIGVVECLRLEFRPLPQPAGMAYGFKAVEIFSVLGNFKCLLDDEYDDVNSENRPCALQVLLLTILDYLDAPSDEIWFTRNGFSGDVRAFLPLLAGLKEFWTHYEHHVQDPERIVSPLSWQLNSEDAHVLRTLSSHFPQKIDVEVSDTKPSLEKPSDNHGFRLDMSRLMFALLLFFAGTSLFHLLANWTGIEALRLGTLVMTIGALYFLFSAFSRLPKDNC